MHENCNPSDCPLEPRITALERANEQHSKTHAGMYDRIRELEKASAVQHEQYQNILDKLDSISDKVDVLEAKPGKRWETLVACVLSALAGAFVLWLASGMPGAK